MTLSVGFHLFNCQSPHAYDRWLSRDYLGSFMPRSCGGGGGVRGDVWHLDSAPNAHGQAHQCVKRRQLSESFTWTFIRVPLQPPCDVMLVCDMLSTVPPPFGHTGISLGILGCYVLGSYVAFFCHQERLLYISLGYSDSVGVDNSSLVPMPKFLRTKVEGPFVRKK